MNELSIGAITVQDRREEFDGSYKRRARALTDIYYLAIHHVGAGDVDSSAESIRRYHVETLGWPGIGYHFLVHWDGSIEYVGDILTVRYNAGGIMNRKVIGINVVGDWMERSPGEVQLEATRALAANLQYALGWFIPILGHGELPGAATSCPGATWYGPDGWQHYVKGIV